MTVVPIASPQSGRCREVDVPSTGPQTPGCTVRGEEGPLILSAFEVTDIKPARSIACCLKMMLFQISKATPGSGFIPFQVSIEPTSGLSLTGERVKDFFLDSLRGGSKSRVSLESACLTGSANWASLPFTPHSSL